MKGPEAKVLGAVGVKMRFFVAVRAPLCLMLPGLMQQEGTPLALATLCGVRCSNLD